MAEPTIQKTFRVPSDLWDSAMQTAADRDVTVSEVLRDALTAFSTQPCTSCGSCDICGGEVLELDQMDEAETATIMGYGSFSTTTNPDVQALIDRAKELLAEGAVGVSVSLDLDPEELTDVITDPEDVDEHALDNIHQRVRHLAIVDTAAFSGAFVDHATDGTISGPLVFEGIPTGDLRTVGPVGSINLESSPLPIPLLFDLEEGDHTGTVIGFIDRLERVSGIMGEGTAPLAASTSAYPAYLFSEPQPGPMVVSEPDAKGYRRYSGTAMPAGVCHKGMGGCYTYKFKGFDIDYFHSGARIPTDDGKFVRVGPLMFGDLHADSNEMDYAKAVTRTNEDAQTVFTMGRVFHHPKGLLYSGVLMPDADVMRVQATAPSVEVWPDIHKRGRPELKTALNVPRPALPVAAALPGGGVQLVSSEPVVVEESHGEHHERLAELSARLEQLENDVAPMLAAHMAENL